MRTLIGNAQSTRDYRSQLRSSKTIWIWAAYLGLLILFATISYSSTVSGGRQSVASIQNQLWQLYTTLISILGFVILIFSPALTAFAIVQERDRKSLDLIFSAPVEPKYLLVGKMMSSFRYVWMLLILALPVTSICVVMGGATWMDVLGAYVALSGMGLIVTSIGLLISTLAGSVTAALVSTLVAVGGYFLIVILLVSEVMMSASSPMMGRSGNDAPFVLAMQPIDLGNSVQTTTQIFGTSVPNWIVAFAVSLLISRLFLLGAGSALSPYGSADTKGLRIYGLVYLGILGFLLAKSTSNLGMTLGSMSSSGSGMTKIQAVLLTWMLIPLLMLMPHLCCHHPSADRKYRSSHLLGFRAAFVGNPDGALLYVVLMVSVYFAGTYFGQRPSGALPIAGLLDAAVWALAFFFFWWAAGRYVSARAKSLRSARIWHIGLILGFIPVGLAILALLETTRGISGEYVPGMLVIHPLWPLMNGEQMSGAIEHTVVLTALGLGLLVFAESIGQRRRRETERLLESPFRQAEPVERHDAAES